MKRYQVKRTYLWVALVVLDLNAFPNNVITLWVFRKLLWTARIELDCTVIFLVFLMMKVSSTTRIVFFWLCLDSLWGRVCMVEQWVGFLFWTRAVFLFSKWVKVAQNIVFLLNKTLYFFSLSKSNPFVLWDSPPL